MSARFEIERWAGSLLPWQVAAFELLQGTATASDDQVARLVEQCISDAAPNETLAHGRAATGPSSAANSNTDELRLKALHSPERVNTLAPDGRLEFAAEGLTVVYGDNGSGKSGYARVLKCACRSRHTPERVLSNVFGTDTGEARATIDFTLNGQDKSAAWADGQAVDEVLRRVSIFDSACANVYVEEEHDVAYVPQGLEVFDRMARLYASVKEAIVVRERALPPPTWPELLAGTATGAALSGLTASSTLDPASGMCGWSPPDDARLAELEGLVDGLRTNAPSKKLAQLEAVRTSVQHIRQHCAALEQGLGGSAGDDLEALCTSHRQKADAAEVSSKASFGSEPLSGIGEAVWRELWNAARKYSEQSAYPARPFPVTEDDPRCVLCQQPLVETAADRLRRFEAFVTDTTSADAESASQALSERLHSIRSLPLVPAGVTADLRVLAVVDSNVASRARAYLRESRRAKVTMLRQVATGQRVARARLLESPVNALDGVIATLNTEHQQLDAAIRNDALPGLESELKELRARKWAHNNIATVRAEVARLSSLGLLARARRTTDTGGLSRKSSDLTETLVTDALHAQFENELTQLNAGGLRVELVKKENRRGITYHHLKLRDARTASAVAEVLSEGEHRVVAVAAFLAEITTSPGNDPIVFDDPVSSLDHVRRAEVARRLVELASSRQVVVFTHDLAFLSRLNGEAEIQGAGATFLRVVRAGDSTGITRDDLPWYAMRASERKGKLKQLVVRAKAIANADPDEYEAHARDIYGRLREAWESGIEELLLNQVVQRMDLGIQTRRLQVVCEDLQSTDYDQIDRAMSRCSEHMRGHDMPRGANAPVPAVDSLERDVEEYCEWVDSMRDRGRR